MMNLSNLQQAICERENELAQIRQAAADAAQHQDEEAKEHMLHVMGSMELEMERTRHESELAIKDAIHQVEGDAAARIERARTEMEQTIQRREDDIFKAAASEMEEEWALREDFIRKEFQTILSTEHEDQEKLKSHYEALIQEKEDAMKDHEDNMARKISEIEEHHQGQLVDMSKKMEEVAEEIWNEACEKFDAAADEKITHSLAMADEHCNARDEQISMLLEERSTMQKLLSEKESLLENSVWDLNEMEKSLKDVALNTHSHHEEEAAKLSEEVLSLARENDHIRNTLREVQSENDLLKGELTQCRLKHTTFEVKYAEQMEAASTFDSEKHRLQSRVGELSAYKQLLERQISDQKFENQELVGTSEMLKKKIAELVQKNEKVSAKALDLANSTDDLQQKHHDLERRHNAAIAHVDSLKQERRDYMKQMEDRLKQKDILLAEALDSINNGSKSRTEPVVVHLHGNSSDNANTSSSNGRLLNECNSLRSKVLQLQRENFRLENELMNTKQKGQTEDVNKSSLVGRGDVAGLQKENTSLKTIISMMRKEMEVVASNNESEGVSSPLPSELVLEQQLLQCRSYLDLLLKAREVGGETAPNDGRAFGGDEIGFLRSKYRALHGTADELREENAKLHTMCNGISSSISQDGPTTREKELILKLEEATDEIESLLGENEKLMALSNELRFELQQTKGRLPSSSDSRHSSPEHDGNKTDESEQTMLDAILSDQNRSCESESRDDVEVACIGRKPPLSNRDDCRPSKNAYGSRPRTASDRTTLSQRQSFQRLLNQKKKEVSVEKTAIRNWNVKDPTSNPYL